jgi:hypothetical protein
MQARQLGLAGRSRMRKDELAYAVSRERHRAATLGRVRWLERIVLPLAAVVLAAVSGAAMPLLIAGGPAEGAAAANVAAVTPASQALVGTAGSDRRRAVADGPTRGRSSDAGRRATPFASGRASPPSSRSAAVVSQEEDSNAVDQPSQVQALSEPSVSPEPHASPGVEPDAEEPSSEPTAGPMPPADEDEQEEGTVTLCHKAGAKKPKTISVGEDAVKAHLAHGDAIGTCP